MHNSDITREEIQDTALWLQRKRCKLCDYGEATECREQYCKECYSIHSSAAHVERDEEGVYDYLGVCNDLILK